MPEILRNRIRVFNTLTEGLDPTLSMPTFIVNLVGLDAAVADEHIETVAFLQAVSPTFRVVLMTDFDDFRTARRLGWPVEHFTAADLAQSASAPDVIESYRARRLAILQASYSRPKVITPTSEHSAAALITAALGTPALAELPQIIAAPSSQPSDDSAATRIEARRAYEIRSPRGHATIRERSSGTNRVFISAADAGAALGNAPAGVAVLEVELSSEATAEFEAYVYETILRARKPQTAVVLPRQAAATIMPNTRFLVDLVVEAAQGQMRVAPEYLEHYQLISGSSILDWDSADKFAMIRRISRAIAKGVR